MWNENDNKQWWSLVLCDFDRFSCEFVLKFRTKGKKSRCTAAEFTFYSTHKGFDHLYCATPAVVRWNQLNMFHYVYIQRDWFRVLCIRTCSIQFKVSQQVWHHKDISVVEEHKRKSCSCSPTLLTFCFRTERWIINLCNYSKRKHLAYARLLNEGPLYDSLCTTCREYWGHLLK